MTAPRIYDDAREKIEKLLCELRSEQSFSSAETAYRVVTVKEELVSLLIHDRLKNLIEEQYNLVGSGHNVMKFTQKENDQWEVVIESGGVESHFFARILEVVTKKLGEDKKNRVNNGKATIRLSFEEVMVAMAKKYVHRVWYKKGTYYILIRINGVKIIFNDQCPEHLKKELADKLPEFIRAITN